MLSPIILTITDCNVIDLPNIMISGGGLSFSSATSSILINNFCIIFWYALSISPRLSEPRNIFSEALKNF